MSLSSFQDFLFHRIITGGCTPVCGLSSLRDLRNRLRLTEPKVDGHRESQGKKRRFLSFM